MTEFDAIRPYHDAEVPAVIANLISKPQVVRAAATLSLPAYLRHIRPVADWITRRGLKRLFGHITTVDQFQVLLSKYFQRMVDTTTDGFTFEGVQHLQPERAYVFVSNHRDISLDSGFMNYALYQSGMATSRIAVGDNLIQEPYATDLMRLNKSFIVRRGLKRSKAAYAAMLLTSKYIRHSQEEGASIWIAQREGRAKDGFDRTDPALIKMFALAYRKEVDNFADIVPQLALVPVSISYELDPCDLIKAHETAVKAATGEYHKPEKEDLQSIATGITGFKGRVHLVFGEPLTDPLPDADAVASALDQQLVSNLKVFATHAYSAQCLASGRLLPVAPDADRSVSVLAERAAACPAQERDALLLQYANVINNRRQLAVTERIPVIDDDAGRNLRSS